MDREFEFRNTFVDSRVENTPEAINYLLANMKKLYSEDLGWVIGTPVIKPQPDGKFVTVTVELTKYKTNSRGGR